MYLLDQEDEKDMDGSGNKNYIHVARFEGRKDLLTSEDCEEFLVRDWTDLCESIPPGRIYQDISFALDSDDTLYVAGPSRIFYAKLEQRERI
jgi:hypothetical protein